MLLGMRFQSEDIQFNKRRYIREKNKHLLLDEAVSKLLDETVAIHEEPIVIGKPLKLSPAFPPLHTVHATFTAHGVPSLNILSNLINLTKEFHCQLISSARSTFSYQPCKVLSIYSQL